MCDCRSGGGPIIINCGGDMRRPDRPDPRDPPPTNERDDNGDTGNGATTALPCSRVIVRVNTLRVNNAGSESFFDNPLDFADVLGDHQWRLTITVGNSSRTIERDPVRDGQSFALGIDFPIDITDANTTFTIQTSGVELQVAGDNDLPPAQATHTLGDNFGIGRTHQIQGVDSDFDYIIDYTITCAIPAIQSLIQRDQIVNFISRLGIASNREFSADAAVNFFIHRMQRNGLRLARMEGNVLMFEGTRTVSHIARQVFRNPKKVAEKSESRA